MIYVIAGKKYGNYLYFHQARDKRQTNHGQARLIFFSETGSPTGRRGKRAKSNLIRSRSSNSLQLILKP